MKQRVIISILSVALIFSAGCGKQSTGTKTTELSGTITMSGAWALYPMAVKWAEEFQKIHPAVKIDVSAGGAGKGVADALGGIVDIGNVSRDIAPPEIEKGAWWVSVVKDAVVPTANANNPVIKTLTSNGLKKQDFINIWVTGTGLDWNLAQSGSNPCPIHVYTRSDSCGAAEIWAKYLGKKQEDLLGVGVYGDPGLAEAVRQDVLGIGFNNINYAYDTTTKKQLQGICVLPIDLNENGIIETNEQFYDTRDNLAAAIADGRYPSPPSRNLHFVCNGKPRKKIVIEFIKWVLTDGQKYVPEAGYINLPDGKLKEELDKL